MPLPLRELDLPPPFRLVALREANDAFAHATAHADQLGAGALVFVGRFDAAEFAVVLEPEEPLVQARRSFYLCMTALADAVSALAPPETPVTIEWPGALEIDRGLVGGGRLSWPGEADEHAVPDWLVFGAMIRLAWRQPDGAAADPSSTALAEEGFGLIGAERLIEGFARHLMLATDRWQEGDFAEIAQDYLARLRSQRDVRRAIDASGNLRVGRPGEPDVVLDLPSALAAPSWLDRETGEPRVGHAAAVAP